MWLETTNNWLLAFFIVMKSFPIVSNSPEIVPSNDKTIGLPTLSRFRRYVKKSTFVDPFCKMTSASPGENQDLYSKGRVFMASRLYNTPVILAIFF